jgi:hypothetical protein
MKKFLLVFMLLPWALGAQNPYRNLIISEAYVHWEYAYIEITNVGEKDINLQEFKLGGGRSTSIPANLTETPWSSSHRMFLPNQILKPGESYVITSAFDFGPREYAKDPFSAGANERPKSPQWYDLADKLMHIPETAGDQTDSITPNWNLLKMWGGDNLWFLEHHYAAGDSAVVDQFNGVIDGTPEYDGRAVAGVDRATVRGPVMRKFKIKTGNLDFANAKGVGAEDSEWIPMPYVINNPWREVWWTVGNHGNFVLNANTLESDVIGIDYPNKKLTVPWGIRRLDGIMSNMKKKPGVVWHYHLNDVYEDSLYRSVRTGDKLEVIVIGDEKTSAIFDIIVSPPTADAKIVVPMDYKTIRLPGLTGPVTTRTQIGIDSWPRVTAHAHGTDTISGVNHGLPFALRTDSLLMRLEKPANAKWEFVWVDGITRPDLKNGDKLKVIAQNGSTKEYFLQMQGYRPSANANLSCITWPDIPEQLKGIYGWKGDTIPAFSSATTEYKLEVPYGSERIPHLVATPQSLNATVEVKRATSLSGSKENRTISFIVTAADKVTKVQYNIELVKAKEPSKIQPYFAEPIISEYVSGDQDRFFILEIYNPGNQPLDLSNYMIASAVSSNVGNTIINNSREADYYRRFRKYVPGYKYVSSVDWNVRPGILEPDLAVNPIVQPGECFIIGYLQTARAIPNIDPWRALGLGPDNRPSGEWIDIAYILRPNDPTFSNPWGEFYSEEYADNCVSQGRSSGLYMFKILNDSVKRGLKPVTDPRDYEVIEALVNADGSNVRIAGVALTTAWQTHIRKPEIQLPNPVNGGSNGTTRENSEWLLYNEAYWQNNPDLSPWPGLRARNHTVFNMNKHYMVEPTFYISTISSIIYKVTDGYSMNEQIRGMKTGITAGEFLGNIIKSDPNQTLIVKSKANGSELTAEALLSNDDLLLVASADSLNFTQYTLEVTGEGLNSDAVLTSSLYDITIESQPKSAGEAVEAGSGFITGFEYGTRLRTVLNNIKVPSGASVDIINSSGAYIPLKIQNFDTAYVDVTVNSNTYLDVLAEDGITRIVYQLLPSSTENDAFVLSDVYTVVQSNNLVQYVPRGTYAEILLSNLIPATGATLKVVDKMGHERTQGSVVQDDKIVVTSANGLVTRVYHLSMLRTQFIPESTYLAYVLSNVYAVDQVGYIIAGTGTNVSVADFSSKLIPSAGATIAVVDANGNERTSGTLISGDGVMVTSMDGKMKVLYDIAFLTSAEQVKENKILLYPNPTSGKVNIQGLHQGVRIQVYNQTGSLIRDLRSNSSIETVSLENQPSGMYIIVLSENSRLMGQYKILRK